MTSHARQQEVLDALADTSPRAYLQRGGGGGGATVLRELHEQAAEVGLAAAAAADDIARLHAMFDVALDHGLGGLVHDYLAEVRAGGGQRAGQPMQCGVASALHGLPATPAYSHAPPSSLRRSAVTAP